MKLYRFLFIFILVASSCISNRQIAQQQSPDMHNSQNSLDWNGVYRGLLPCADCVGILTELELHSDLSYQLSYQYQGASSEVHTEKGRFKWDDSGSKISLIGDDQSTHRNYQVGENQLFSLDGDGNRISGELAELFILKKVGFDQKITEKYWKLVELNGKAITVSDTQPKEAHFILKEASNKVNGHSGCNGIRGSYTLEGLDQISFSQMVSTRMACQNVPYESDYLKALEQTDHYVINGDSLHLKMADKELAKFVAVWFH